jgi:hypothetical protein
VRGGKIECGGALANDVMLKIHSWLDIHENNGQAELGWLIMFEEISTLEAV